MFKELDHLERDISRDIDTDLTRSDIADWRIHPVTQLLFNEIKLYLLDQQSLLVENTPSDETARITELLMRGEINGLRWVLDWQPEHISKQAKDET